MNARMKFPFAPASGFSTGLLALALLLYGGVMALQEWRFRQQLPQEVAAAPGHDAAPVREPLNLQAVASVLGLTPGGTAAPSAEPITLQASFVAAHGASRALLADAAGSRFYREGERLPGGSVLRRVEIGHVMLWRNGREESLVLQQKAEPLLRQTLLEDERQKALHSSQYLRPLGGLPE